MGATQARQNAVIAAVAVAEVESFDEIVER